MATVSKANKPRKGSLLTRNGRIRLGPLNLTQLTEMMEKTPSKRMKTKIRGRILILEKRARREVKTV
jgi:hypothetical protein